MEVNLGEIARLKQRLQSLYIRAESLMLKPEGVKPLERFLPEIDSCFEKLIEACDPVPKDELVPGTDWSKLDLMKEKESFDVHAVRWFSHNEPLQKSELVSASKAPSYSVMSGSSTKSEKLRSQVRLKVATVAMEQESTRGYETRLRARQRAEEKKKKILADAERKQKELERKTRQEMERTLEEVDRELFEIEESAAENLRKKELEFEMARAEASAWNEVADIPAPEVQPNVNDMSARAIPIIEPDEVTGQADPRNVHTVHVPWKFRPHRYKQINPQII